MDSQELLSGHEPAQEELESPAQEDIQGEESVGKEPTHEEKTEEETESSAQPKKKKSVQQRIDELTYRWRQAERELEYWRNLALQAQQANQPVQQAASEVRFDKPRPKPEDYDSQEAYEDALFQWWEARRRVEQETQTQQQEMMKLVNNFMTRAAEFKKEHPDFDYVIQAPVYTDTMRDIILRSEEGPQIAYYLGLPENRAEAERIASLPLSLQAKELGKLAAKLTMPKGKKVSSAPPPINPVKGEGGTISKHPDKMTPEEYMRWRREQRVKQQRR